jgi:hypothetical protein
VNPPSLAETLEIARGLTHSTFTQAKQLAIVAGIEHALSGAAPTTPGPYSDMGGTAQYTIELKGPVDIELFNPNVSDDEIDEDPPTSSAEQPGAFTADNEGAPTGELGRD